TVGGDVLVGLAKMEPKESRHGQIGPRDIALMVSMCTLGMTTNRSAAQHILRARIDPSIAALCDHLPKKMPPDLIGNMRWHRQKTHRRRGIACALSKLLPRKRHWCPGVEHLVSSRTEMARRAMGINVGQRYGHSTKIRAHLYDYSIISENASLEVVTWVVESLYYLMWRWSLGLTHSVNLNVKGHHACRSMRVFRGMTPLQLQEHQMRAIYDSHDDEKHVAEPGLCIARNVVGALVKKDGAFNPAMPTPLADSMIFMARPDAQSIMPASASDCNSADQKMYGPKLGGCRGDRGPCDVVAVSQLSTRVFGKRAHLRKVALPPTLDAATDCERERTVARRRIGVARNRSLRVSNPNYMNIPDALVAMTIDLDALAFREITL
ncbi:MAG: hypothetical protein JKX97_00495, partial [Candidatus Lindowbacteria bacterium]|nr:hypothetical protein [Candidatus Lindowbacteria bacterium]